MPSTQRIAKIDKAQKIQFERITKSIGTTPADALRMENQEAEDIADANIADKITQEMQDANIDIHTLTTQSEMKRKYAI